MKQEKLLANRLTKKRKLLNGYTFVELLIAMFIISTISSITVGIVWITLRSIKKVNNMQLIRQNGSFAITQMSKMLQYSQQFQGVSNDDITYTTACLNPSQQFRYVKFVGQDNGITTFSCLTGTTTVASNSATLIDTNQFSVTPCYFTCIQTSPGTPYTIGIQFTIQKRTASNDILDDPSAVPFKTSVTLRNSY